MTIASPVPEAGTKLEEAVSFSAPSGRVKTIAAWIPASRQILDDLTELAGFLETSLTYYVEVAEELQILSGDGTDENLHARFCKPPRSTLRSSAEPRIKWTSLAEPFSSSPGAIDKIETISRFFVPAQCCAGIARYAKEYLRFAAPEPETGPRFTLSALAARGRFDILFCSFLVGSFLESGCYLRCGCACRNLIRLQINGEAIAAGGFSGSRFNGDKDATDGLGRNGHAEKAELFVVVYLDSKRIAASVRAGRRKRWYGRALARFEARQVVIATHAGHDVWNLLTVDGPRVALI
jgi:hypothetical protein